MHNQDLRILTNTASAGKPVTRLPAASAEHGQASLPDRWLVRRLLQSVGQPPVTIVLWDGATFLPDGAEPIARLVIHKRRALQKLVANPEYEFGELYSTGRIDIE